uniref:Uncharacterized protein n=1 Tax=Arundo donax TaxID=35708 RepID=A0A0A8YK92_ARUDO
MKQKLANQKDIVLCFTSGHWLQPQRSPSTLGSSGQKPQHPPEQYNRRKRI